MNFGAYVLSTTDGFSFIPFAVKTVCKLLEGRESLLDLDSMLGLKAGHVVMRYQNIAVQNVTLHAYSIYHGAQEINAGRSGSFIGVTFIFEEKIDAEKIELGQKLREFVNGLACLFINNKRFVKKVDIKSVKDFCDDNNYKNTMQLIIRNGLPLPRIASGKNKKIFYFSSMDLYNSFNAICNSENTSVEFYLMGAAYEQYIQIAKSIFSHVSSWPIPSIEGISSINAAVQQNSNNKLRTQNISQRQERKTQKREYNENEYTTTLDKYIIDWEPYLKNIVIIVIVIFSIFGLLLFFQNIIDNNNKRDEMFRDDIQKTYRHLDKIEKYLSDIDKKLTLITEKFNSQNAMNMSTEKMKSSINEPKSSNKSENQPDKFK